jgi:hypothetical protein
MPRALAVPVLVLGIAAPPPVTAAEGIPYFARRYGVTCQQCHVLPPRLNAFGEAFVANNYSMEGLPSRRTLPLALWVSGRTDAVPTAPEVAHRVRSYINRVELISGGPVGSPAVAYFLEWRPVSFETRGDGTLRDRSGRFEDLFVVLRQGVVELTLGQYRQLAQVDVSRRLSVSEPAFYALSVPGAPARSSRLTSLRGFSLSGRSPALRAAWLRPTGGWIWSTAATVPFPGELSVPLTRNARTEASLELELDPKGVFLESFARRGVRSVGGHLFWDGPDRFLAGGLGTGGDGVRFLTAGLGVERSGGTSRGRWMLEGEWIPSPMAGLGMRVEDRAGDGQRPAVVTFANAHVPGTRHTFRLTVEWRRQRDRDALLVELGAVF